MRYRIAVAIVLLAAVFCPGWASGQLSGSGGVALDRAAAGAMVSAAAPVTFLGFSGRVDHVAAGTGLRNSTSGTIRLRGIPAGSTVVRAFLYWAMICSASTCPASVTTEFEGQAIDSALFSTSPSPCWAGTTLGAYRVDVTGLMPGSTTAAVANKVINRDYQISNFPFNALERDGRDPWGPATANLPKMEGATLLVIYSNPNLPLSGRVYIHHGATTSTGILNVTNVLSPVAPSSELGFAKFTRFGADGQVGTGTAATLSTSGDQTFFGGPRASCAGAALAQIAGPTLSAASPTRNPDSDWNGSDGGPLNQLWDTHTSTVTGLLGPGAANYCVRYISAGDCIVPIGYVLSVQ